MKLVINFSLRFLFFFFLFMCINCVLLAQASINIKGTIKNILFDIPTTIYLFSFYGTKLFEVDSVSLDRNGSFTFKPHRPHRKGLYKLGFDKEHSATIVLSNDENNIIIESYYEQLKADDILVVNSKENESYRAFLNVHNRHVDEMDKFDLMKLDISNVDTFFMHKTEAIDNKLILLISKYNKQLLHLKENFPDTFATDVLVSLCLSPQLTNHPELKDSYENQRAFLHDYYFEFIDFTNETIIYTPYLLEKYVTYLDKYTYHTSEEIKNSIDLILSKANANKAVWEFTIQFMIDTFNIRGLEELLDYIVGYVETYEHSCNSHKSEKVIDNIENIKRLRIGKPAPDIISKEANGNTIPLSSLIGKRVLMVYFWASWCDICQIESSNIVRIYNKYKNKGFGVYAVSLDSDKVEWLTAISDYRFTWTNVSDLNGWNSNSAGMYNIMATPTIYLLDKEGIIIDKNLRSYQLEMRLDKLLN